MYYPYCNLWRPLICNQVSALMILICLSSVMRWKENDRQQTDVDLSIFPPTIISPIKCRDRRCRETCNPTDAYVTLTAQMDFFTHQAIAARVVGSLARVDVWPLTSALQSRSPLKPKCREFLHFSVFLFSANDRDKLTE